MEAATRNLQILKNEHADWPAKQCDTLPHLRHICVELSCSEKFHFQKYVNMQYILYNVVERIM
jgi:hypothetical protein